MHSNLLSNPIFVFLNSCSFKGSGYEYASEEESKHAIQHAVLEVARRRPLAALESLIFQLDNIPEKII